MIDHPADGDVHQGLGHSRRWHRNTERRAGAVYQRPKLRPVAIGRHVPAAVEQQIGHLLRHLTQGKVADGDGQLSPDELPDVSVSSGVDVAWRIARAVVTAALMSLSEAISLSESPRHGPLRMPRALALEGLGGLQDEVVAVARADDLHADRQARAATARSA